MEEDLFASFPSLLAANGSGLDAYLGTVVGGRRGVENGPAGGIQIFSARGGPFCSRRGVGSVKLQKSPKKALFKGGKKLKYV